MFAIIVKSVKSRYRDLVHAARRDFATRVSQKTVQRCLGQPTAYTHPFLMKEKEVTPGLTQEIYKKRRQNLVELIVNEKEKPGSEKHLIVVLGSPISYMTQDIPYTFHQNTNFLYLTGFQEPDSCLVIEIWNANNHSSTLFVPKRDPLKELWNGSRAGTDGALEHTGVDRTDETDNLGTFLKSNIAKGTTIWYDYTRMSNLQLHLSQVRGFLQEAHKDGLQIRQIEEPLHEQKNIKTPEECALMSKASDIISEAFIDAMAHSKPGMNESEIHARLEYTAKIKGAQMLAFPPVVAGGSRANTLHYVVNNQNIDDGSLVLVDAGAYYHGYVSDVTRTWPISGKPGHSLDEIYNIMSMALGKELYDIGVLKEKMKAPQLADLVRMFCPHHVGHWLGMDVHDTPGIHRSMKLLPGMVVTIEPGVYIAENEARADPVFRGMGIRIEDDVVVTAGDPVVLSEKCPKTVEDIEKIMAA